MTRPEIIELANQQSERKAEKIGTLLPSYYRFVCQDICKRQRFWWRRIYFSFQTTPGTPLYDLTQVATTPSNAMQEILIEEITKFTLVTSPSPYQTAQLVPVFDPEALIDMVNNTSITSPVSGNNQAPGGRYTMDPSGVNVVRLDPPDNAYTAFIVGWGMPEPPTESALDTVPLIPAWGHNAIVAGIVAKVFKFAYGSKNEKTTDAQLEYEQAIQDLAAKRQFAPNYDLQLSLREGAVRST